MKATYWIAECLTDSKAYNLRAKTRREVVTRLANTAPGDYSEPRRVTVEYLDGFDLIGACLSEGGGYWEY